MRYPLGVTILILALLPGCATRPKRIPLQTKATTYTAGATTKVTDVQVKVSDGRANRSLDSVLARSASEEVSSAIRKALLASKVVLVDADAHATLEVECKLARLDWVVPEYEALLKRATAARLLTGMIGAIAYESSSVFVQGNAVLQLNVTQSGQGVFTRDYVGFCEEYLAKWDCDTKETKSRLAGSALSNAVEKFLKDLDQFPTVESSGK